MSFSQSLVYSIYNGTDPSVQNVSNLVTCSLSIPKSQNVYMMGYQVNGNQYDTLIVETYFKLIDDLNPNYYTSYQLQATLTSSAVPNAVLSATPWTLIPFLSVNGMKMCGPITRNLQFLSSSNSLTINVSLLFPAAIMRANRVYKLEFILISQKSKSYDTSTAISNATSLALPMVFGTNLPLSIPFTPDNTNVLYTPWFLLGYYATSATDPPLTVRPVITILAAYQTQQSVNGTTTYPASKNTTTSTVVRFSQSDNGYTDIVTTTKFEAGIVFTINQAFNPNSSNLTLPFSVNKLWSAQNVPSLMYYCTFTCIIQNQIMTTPVITCYAKNTNLKSNGLVQYNLTIDVIQYFPALLTSVSTLCFLRVKGYLKNMPNSTKGMQTLPGTFLSPYQSQNLFPTNPLQQPGPLGSPFVFGGNYLAFPQNAMGNIEGFATLPTLSLNETNLNASINILHLSQQMNITEVNLFKSTQKAFLPTMVTVDIVFELKAPLNDAVSFQSLILTLRNLGFLNPSNWRYLVSATMQVNSTQFYCSNHFVTQLGGGDDQGWLYTVYPYRNDLSGTVNDLFTFGSSYRNWYTNYSFGPYRTDTMTPVPFPGFENNYSNTTTNDFTGPGVHMINDFLPNEYLPNDSSSTKNTNYISSPYGLLQPQGVLQWTGYLDIQQANQWFGMYVKSADDGIVVSIFDQYNSKVLLAQWTYGIIGNNAINNYNSAYTIYNPNNSGHPIVDPLNMARFYRFPSTGLYPITVSYYNTGGPAHYTGVVMGYLGSKELRIVMEANTRNPYRFDEAIRPNAIPGLYDNLSNVGFPGMEIPASASNTYAISTNGVLDDADANVSIRTGIFVLDDCFMTPGTDTNPDLSKPNPDMIECMTLPIRQQFNFLPPMIKTPSLRLNLNNLFPKCVYEVGKKYKLSIQFTHFITPS